VYHAHTRNSDMMHDTSFLLASQKAPPRNHDDSNFCWNSSSLMCLVWTFYPNWDFRIGLTYAKLHLMTVLL